MHKLQESNKIIRSTTTRANKMHKSILSIKIQLNQVLFYEDTITFININSWVASGILIGY